VKCLVTGGAGFIGSNLVDRLLQLGHEVIAIDNESSESHEKFYWNNKCENHKLDICHYEQISSLFKNVDWVFHLAAEARIQPAILNPLKAIKTNVLGTCNVLQASREHKIKRVIYSSTSSAYGTKNIPPLVETMPKDCLNPYSVSKTSGEELCSMYYKLFGLQTVIFRYFNVYGERQPTKGQYAPVIGLFLKQKELGKKMTVVGDGLQKRDFTHISDIVNANILAASTNNLEIFGETFNIGTGINYSILELVKIIGGDYEHIPARMGEAKITLANINKAKNMLNWQPKIILEDWINANK